jgi:hypothetical protein
VSVGSADDRLRTDVAEGEGRGVAAVQITHERPAVATDVEMHLVLLRG